MPDCTTLAGSRIAVLYNNTDEDDGATDDVRMWFKGEVISITHKRSREVIAEIKWDVRGDNTFKKLGEDDWAGPKATLDKGSWMLVPALPSSD
eukprot:3221793-Ditylum_brightwellii.AAC.1